MPQQDDRTTATVAEEFGKFLTAEGRDAAETEQILKRAVEANRRFSGEGSVQFAFTLEALAKFQGKQRRFEEAQKLVDEIRRIREKSLPADHNWIAEATTLSARIAVDRGDWATARSLLMRATTAVNPARRHFNTLREMEALLIRATWNVAAGNARERAGLVAEAFTSAQRALPSKAGDALASMAARSAPGDGELGKAVRETQDAQVAFVEATKRVTVAQGAKGKHSEEAIEQLRAEMRRARARHDEAAALLLQRFPGYSEYAMRPTVPLDTVQRQLKGDEALLLYVVAEPESFVFAVTREAVDWKKIDKGREVLSREVADFRIGLEVEVAAGGDAPLFDLGRAHALYRLLLGPLEETLKGKRHLLVVPSGALTSVPFHLLVAQAPANPKPSRTMLAAYREAAWVARTYSVSVLPTASSLKSLRELPASSRAAKPMIGFGNPVFAQPRTAERERGEQKTVVAVAGRSRGYKAFWQGDKVDLEALRDNLLPLPDTEDELKTVAARVGAAPADVLLGAKATEAAVKRLDLTPYRIVYFATHGLVAGEIGISPSRRLP